MTTPEPEPGPEVDTDTEPGPEVNTEPEPVPEVDTALQDANIAAHNHYRELHDAKPLVWDAECYTTAQKWAVKLADEAGKPGKDGKNKGMSHGGVVKGMGQNLWWSPDDTASPEDAVAAWMRQAKHYSVENPTTAGHFTQVVWKKTRKVGLGIVRIPRPSDLDGAEGIPDDRQTFQFGTFFVVNYDPHGNSKGKFEKNVSLPAEMLRELRSANTDLTQQLDSITQQLRDAKDENDALRLQRELQIEKHEEKEDEKQKEEEEEKEKDKDSMSIVTISEGSGLPDLSESDSNPSENGQEISKTGTTESRQSLSSPSFPSLKASPAINYHKKYGGQLLSPSRFLTAAGRQQLKSALLVNVDNDKLDTYISCSPERDQFTENASVLQATSPSPGRLRPQDRATGINPLNMLRKDSSADGADASLARERRAPEVKAEHHLPFSANGNGNSRGDNIAMAHHVVHHHVYHKPIPTHTGIALDLFTPKSQTQPHVKSSLRGTSPESHRSHSAVTFADASPSPSPHAQAAGHFVTIVDDDNFSSGSPDSVNIQSNNVSTTSNSNSSSNGRQPDGHFPYKIPSLQAFFADPSSLGIRCCDATVGELLSTRSRLLNKHADGNWTCKMCGRSVDDHKRDGPLPLVPSPSEETLSPSEDSTPKRRRNPFARPVPVVPRLPAQAHRHRRGSPNPSRSSSFTSHVGQQGQRQHKGQRSQSASSPNPNPNPLTIDTGRGHLVSESYPGGSSVVGGGSLSHRQQMPLVARSSPRSPLSMIANIKNKHEHNNDNKNIEKAHHHHHHHHHHRFQPHAAQTPRSRVKSSNNPKSGRRFPNQHRPLQNPLMNEALGGFVPQYTYKTPPHSL